MGNTFIISDMHFGHKNIISYENRPFNNVDEMDKAIIDNWNKTVTTEDTVFILGDVSFYNKDKTKEIVSSLKGKKILILGNHDKAKTSTWWKETGFEEVISYPIILDEFYILSHEPVYLSKNMPYANIHGHIHHLKYEDIQYFNVSVECINYTPIDFNSIKETISAAPNN